MAKRTDVAVKLDAEVVRVAKIVAAFEDKSLAEYLSDTLGPIVNRALEEHSRRVQAPKPGKGGKPSGGSGPVGNA